ncbi:MAG: GNAT family N-acetyltransferase [Desulfovibrio sp.]|jgi:GNAT superfamily N-acetyltransferase|nr:GNAT family N-acetyltransferase [Desulfovibrio sp.]
MLIRFCKLSKEVKRDHFICGEPKLDVYLKQIARQDMVRGYSDVIIATDPSNVNAVYGFYTIAAAVIPLSQLPDAVAKKLPRYPEIPSIRLGRLAVDLNYQNRGVGGLLVVNAMERILTFGQIWAMLTVDAKDDQAEKFYRKFGFDSFKMPKELSLWLNREAVESFVKEQTK